MHHCGCAEICSVCEKVAGVASEDRTDPDTYDVVLLEWSADVSAARFLTVTGTEFQISALKSRGDTDFPDVLSVTTPARKTSLSCGASKLLAFLG